MTAEDIIKQAGILIKEHGWCQGYHCVDSETGIPVRMGVDIGKKEGYHHCILGAMRQFAFDFPEGGSYEAFRDAMEKVARAITEDDSGCVSISEWNDNQGRTIEEVLNLLRKALQPI